MMVKTGRLVAHSLALHMATDRGHTEHQEGLNQQHAQPVAHVREGLGGVNCCFGAFRRSRTTPRSRTRPCCDASPATCAPSMRPFSPLPFLFDSWLRCRHPL